MSPDPTDHRPLSPLRPLAALTLLLVAGAVVLAAQPAEENRIERRIQVVFSDEEGVTEESLWVDSGDGPVRIDGEATILSPPLFHPRPYLGVHLLDITPELRTHFGATAETGVLVSSVAVESPAAAAGVEVGDVLTTIDGEAVARTGQVLRQLAGREEGDPVSLGLVRARRSLEIGATLTARPRAEIDLAPMFGAPHDGERRVLRLPHQIIEIHRGDLDQAFSELHQRLESPEWRSRLEETASRRLTLENRIRELEQRLLEMERRLREEPE